jgi:hypothetical protein
MDSTERAKDTLRRCRWAKMHNNGRPNGAWSTGEQLAVAFILRDTETLAANGYTVQEAAQRLYGDMIPPPADWRTWVEDIRHAIATGGDL